MLPAATEVMARAVSEAEIERRFGYEYAARLNETPTPDAPEPLDEQEE